jgi:hypothetical protein
MTSEKYIGYLESQIANAMWPSGLIENCII